MVTGYEGGPVGFEVRATNFKTNGLFRCHLEITREDNDQFSVVVLNLPGAVSCGSTVDEAIEGVREAVTGLVQSYRDDEVDIPWRDVTEYEITDGASQRWILVNVD